MKKELSYLVLIIIAVAIIGIILFIQFSIPQQGIKCPDSICDEYERAHPDACPQDCKGVGQQTEQTKNITYIYNWTMFGHDASHNGYSSSEAPNTNNILWSYTASLQPEIEKDVDKDVHGLVYDSGKLYFTFDKYVHTIDTSNGKVLWNTNLGDETGELAIVDGKIFVGGKKGLYALDVKNGNKLWNYETSKKITAPAIVADKIYFGSDDQYLYAIKTDGTFVWKFLTEGSIHSYPAVATDRVCFASENPDFSIYCLNATTGEKLWRRTFPHDGGIGGMFHAPPVIFNNMVLIGEEGGKRGVRQSGMPITPAPSNFYALDINTGNTLWSYLATDWIVTSAAVGYDKVYFSTWDGNIYAININDGKLVWQAKGSSSPVVADGKVFVGSSSYVFSYNADNGNVIWSYPNKAESKLLIIGDGKLYAGFAGGDVIAQQIIAFGK